VLALNDVGRQLANGLVVGDLEALADALDDDGFGHQSFSANRSSSRAKTACASQRKSSPATTAIAPRSNRWGGSSCNAASRGCEDVGVQKARLLSSTAIVS